MNWGELLPGSQLPFIIAKPGPSFRFLHDVYGVYPSPTGPALVTGDIVQGLAHPVRIDGRVVLDQGHYVLRHDFLDQWYNLCLFFAPRGRLAGYYCDLQTPLRLEGGAAHCTDLLLDLWVFPGEVQARVLDRDEYGEAVRGGWIPADRRRMAACALRHLLAAVRGRRFPTALTGTRVPGSFLRPRP
ncbi:MAG: DUF402 domain-containing protein [bacterium]|nr:DUF402 domain-containing protein [bacterium]